MTARAWAEIDIAAIKTNVAAIRSFAGPKTDVMPVVKADAYGHGMEAVARAVWEAGTRWVGVATVAEGLRVRDLLPQARICVFSPFCPAESDEIAAHSLTPFISLL